MTLSLSFTLYSTANFKTHFIAYTDISTILHHVSLCNMQKISQRKHYLYWNFNFAYPSFTLYLRKDSKRNTLVLLKLTIILSCFSHSVFNRSLQNPFITYFTEISTFDPQVTICITQKPWKLIHYLYWYFNFPIKSI